MMTIPVWLYFAVLGLVWANGFYWGRMKGRK
jgi:hypothetical protein